MPNLSALVQAAYTAFTLRCKRYSRRQRKNRQLRSGMMGVAKKVNQKYMDAITGLSGSGPGYVSIIIEALTYAGLKVGLPRNIALKSRSPKQ